MLRYIITCVIVFFMSNKTIAQEYIQLSGTIVELDSTPVGYATISVTNTNRHTVANAKGYFSITIPASQPSVTISAVGLKTKEFIVPVQNIVNQSYFARISLYPDTQYTKEVIVRGMSRKQWKETFIRTEIPDDLVTIAENNLSEEKLANKNDIVDHANPNIAAMVQSNQQLQKNYYAGGQNGRMLNIIGLMSWLKLAKNTITHQKHEKQLRRGERYTH